MKEDLLPIGKMAKLNRVSISTLRLYDEKGLLKPRYTDPDTGYRYYDIYQNARLDMIAYMKELGMSLSRNCRDFSKGRSHADRRYIGEKKMNRFMRRSGSSRPGTTRWNARLYLLNGIGKRPLRGRCRWNTSISAIYGACHAPPIFTAAICAALKRCCWSFIGLWKKIIFSRSTPITSVRLLQKKTLQTTGLSQIRFLFLRRAMSITRIRRCKLSKAECTPVHTLTITTMKSTAPES